MRRKLIVFTLSVLMLLSITACSASNGSASNQSVQKQIVVTAQKPVKRELETYTEFVGKLTATESSSVYPRLSGIVNSVAVSVGDTVRKGDLLFSYDDTDIRLSLKSAELAVDIANESYNLTVGGSADSTLTQLQAAVKQARMAYDAAEEAYDNAENAPSATTVYPFSEEQIEAARQNAALLNSDFLQKKDEYERALAEYEQLEEPSPEETQVLSGKKTDMDTAEISYEAALSTYKDMLNQTPVTVGVTKAQLESASRALDQARLAYDSARASLDIAKDSTLPASAELSRLQYEQALSAYESAARQLLYSRTTAPCDGVVTSVNVKVNEPFSPSAPAVTISSSQSMTATLAVTDAYIDFIKVGDSVTAQTSEGNIPGIITEISPEPNPVTGLYSIKVELPNTENLLKAGMTARIAIVTSRSEDTWVLPLGAVNYDSEGSYVYIIDEDNTAHRLNVTTGIYNTEYIEILSGMEPGMTVITSGHPMLADGIGVIISQ